MRGTWWRGSRGSGARPEGVAERERLGRRELTSRLEALEQRQAQADESGRKLAAAVRDLSALVSIAGQLDGIEEQQVTAHRELTGIRRELDRLRLQSAAALVTAWLSATQPDSFPLVSVVLSTDGSAEPWIGAIDSLARQTYPNWELLVVGTGPDDAGLDGALPEELRRRVRLLPARGDGAGGARDVALNAARGELVAYLDAAVLMHPVWLTALAWGFGRQPDRAVLVGGLVGVAGDPGAVLPTWTLPPTWPDAAAEPRGFSIAALAHRAGVFDARFDTGAGAEWAMYRRLAEAEDVLALPVVAGYRTRR